MLADNERPQTGDKGASETPDQAAKGGEGTTAAQATPPIQESDQRPGQTQTPAPEDETGVPENVEGGLGRE